MSASEKREWNFKVEAWHVVLLLAVQLVGLGVAYGRINEKQEELSRDIVRLESQRSISKDEFDDWKNQLNERMTRIESKLDAQLKFK